MRIVLITFFIFPIVFLISLFNPAQGYIRNFPSASSSPSSRLQVEKLGKYVSSNKIDSPFRRFTLRDYESSRNGSSRLNSENSSNDGNGIKSSNPKRRLANLGKKLGSVLELEKLDYDLLNNDQKAKLDRKDDILNEMKALQHYLNEVGHEEKKSSGALMEESSSTRIVELLEINENKRNRKEKSNSGGLDKKGGLQDTYHKKSKKRAELSSLKRNAKPLDALVTSGKIPRTLLKMMIFCRVAGSDTCKLLLELGRVKVNGVVEKNIVALVDLDDDVIEVEDERLILPEDKKIKEEKNSEEEGNEDGEENDEKKWSNFKKTIPKEYRASLDGGILIDKTRAVEKSRGTYVDKSAYANKQPFLYGEKYKGQRYSAGRSASNFLDNRNKGASSSSSRSDSRRTTTSSSAPRRRPSTSR